MAERLPVDPTIHDSPKDLLDVTEVVRSLHRQEGYPHCYKRSGAFCNQEDCFCRPWCVKTDKDGNED